MLSCANSREENKTLFQLAHIDVGGGKTEEKRRKLYFCYIARNISMFSDFWDSCIKCYTAMERACPLDQIWFFFCFYSL